MANKKFDLFNYIDELPSRLYIVLGVIFLAVHTAVCTYTETSPTACGLLLIFLYVICVSVIFIISRRHMAIKREEFKAAKEQNSGVISAFRDTVNFPYAVVSSNGKIITVNNAFKAVAGNRETYFNAEIKSVCDIDLQALIDSINSDFDTDENGEQNKNAPADFKTTIGENLYSVSCHSVISSGQTYYLLAFDDITSLTNITDTLYRETPAIAYIVIDNLEEIAQYVKGSYRAEANQVENILKDFATSMNGILREYDRDKYMLVFQRQNLVECIKNKFSVLDTVRQVRIGDDSIPVTVSIGVAITGSNLSEREHDALAALDLALQRGGDQVVVKNEKGVNYFGGMTKSQQKRTRVHSRVIANKLCSEISAATNVLVMGHANPDFDAIGACVGVASLAMYLEKDVRIIADKNNENFKACTEKLRELDEYKNIFIDGVEGLERYSFGTLLVVVDANNFSILEAPEIAEKSFKTIVIDHHIKKGVYENEPLLTYIDPSASSACELVSEILEQSLPAGVLKKEEATVILSGIMVDTKNFTRTVGTRTFSAALHLRSAGANSEVARTFFNEAFEDYRSEAMFGAEVEVYRDSIAITTSSGTGSAQDRVSAAKAADKLLTVRNVHAAFALVIIDDVIHISGRSDGTVNVQLILEKIGGGGHFDMAGAALKEKTMEEAKTMLKNAIDSHLDGNDKKADNSANS